ncbi:hypothetical protein ACFWYW_14520 [Nonomuraea sp. NPDC059023]|uniref:hypothetical protein n=1 Tax=unclassified Nonomuraea TaxID=2593643 RepID=UPI0036789AB2
MPAATREQLRLTVLEALRAAGADHERVDTALWDCDLEIVPRLIGDERHWRLIVDGRDQPRLLDADELLREFAFTLISRPCASVIVRPADAEEVNAFLFLGSPGLAGVDERRQRVEALVGQELVEALDAALSQPPAGGVAA